MAIVSVVSWLENYVEGINGLPVSTVPGTCKSKNVIYLVSCKLCKKPYIGRTVQHLHNRMAGHRDCFYKVLRNDDDVDTSSDDYSLGLHLTNEHNCIDRDDFDELYNVKNFRKLQTIWSGKERTHIHT